MLKYIFLLLISFSAHARVLELIPAEDDAKVKLVIDWRSDLWVTPDHSKNSPVRTYNLLYRTPIFKSQDAKQTISFLGEVNGFSSGRADLIVGKKRVLIGSDLRSQRAGLIFKQNLDLSSWFTFAAAYTSESDEPYSAKGSSWAEVSATYAFATTNDLQWVLLLNYSKNRGYLNNKTIPLIGAFYKVSPELSLAIGLPFIEATYLIPEWISKVAVTPTGINAEVNKILSPRFNWRSHAGLVSQAYLHANRDEDDMRLFYEETYLDTGIQAKISDQKSLEFLVGGSYERGFYEAKQVFIPAGKKTNLQNDFYGRIRFEVQL